MNQYPIWIGLVVALLMACLAPNPLWWMIAAIGIGANGVVVAANGWKMPALGLSEESVRHIPMTKSTRRRWLADIIPTGFGKASLGDFFIAAGVMGGYATRSQFADGKLIALLGIAWWSSGWLKGFDLFEKWPKEARRDARKNIPIVIALMVLGNLLNFRGCGVSELRASAESATKTAFAPKESPKPKDKPRPKWRDLGAIAPPPQEVLTRLRQDTRKRSKDIQALQDAIKAATNVQTVTMGGAVFVVNPSHGITPRSGRSGPFCRITCAAHHGGEYDVETLPAACQANWDSTNGTSRTRLVSTI